MKLLGYELHAAGTDPDDFKFMEVEEGDFLYFDYEAGFSLFFRPSTGAVHEEQEVALPGTSLFDTEIRDYQIT